MCELCSYVHITRKLKKVQRYMMRIAIYEDKAEQGRANANVVA